MDWWMWLAFGLILLVLELVVPGGFYVIFFGAGALGVGILAAAAPGLPGWTQWLLFTGLSVAALWWFREPLVQRYSRVPGARTDVDSLVGETALVLEPIAVNDIGKAELRGTTWSARNIGGTPLTAAQRCHVERVEGLVLCVRGQ